jgi:hypothetical protein
VRCPPILERYPECQQRKKRILVVISGPLLAVPFLLNTLDTLGNTNFLGVQNNCLLKEGTTCFLSNYYPCTPTYPFFGLVSLDQLVKLDHSMHTIVQRKTYIQSLSTTISFMHAWQSTIQRHLSENDHGRFYLDRCCCSCTLFYYSCVLVH